MTPASRPYTVHWTVNISGHENNRNKVFYRILLTRSWNYYTKKTGLGIRSSVFWANRSFFRKNERMRDLLKKVSNLLIRSFFVSDLSDLLMVAHFLWATWANRSWSLIFSERHEQFTHIAHFWWATWAICSHRSLKKREWANCFFFFFYVQKTYQKIRF